MVSQTLRVLEAYRTCYDLCNSVLEYLGHDIKESLLFPRNQIGHLRSREYSHRHLPMQHPRPFVKVRWHSRLFCEDLQGVALCFLAHLCKIMSKNCTRLAKYVLCMLGVSPNFEITVAFGLKFHRYLRTLSLKLIWGVFSGVRWGLGWLLFSKFRTSWKARPFP